MDTIFSPWRMEYIVGEKSETCIFCEKVAHPENDQAEHVIYRGERIFIVLNRYPYNNGHLMVVPYRHAASTEDLTVEELAEMMAMVNRSLTLLRGAMQPNGFNMGINLGKVAGAGIESHVHMHIVPRWEADTNFMPIVAKTRVIPQWIDETYDLLRRALAEDEG